MIGDIMETKEIIVDGEKKIVVIKMDPNDYESSDIITVEEVKDIGDNDE